MSAEYFLSLIFQYSINGGDFGDLLAIRQIKTGCGRCNKISSLLVHVMCTSAIPCIHTEFLVQSCSKHILTYGHV